MNNSLESHKFFPIIAWLIVIGFFVFTYVLAMHLRTEISNLGDGVERLEQKLDEMEQKNQS